MKRHYLCLLAMATWAGSAAGALAAGDAAEGEKVANKCKACHQIGDSAATMVAPKLNGVIGRKAGTLSGYNYSNAMKESGITWDEASLNEFLANPKAKVPGTKMMFPGLPKDSDRENVIAYLSQFDADGKKK